MAEAVKGFMSTQLGFGIVIAIGLLVLGAGYIYGPVELFDKFAGYVIIALGILGGKRIVTGKNGNGG